jgi:hypothetical protein
MLKALDDNNSPVLQGMPSSQRSGVLNCTRGSHRRIAIYDVVQIIEVAATVMLVMDEAIIRHQPTDTVIACCPANV